MRNNYRLKPKPGVRRQGIHVNVGIDRRSAPAVRPPAKRAVSNAPVGVSAKAVPVNKHLAKPRPEKKTPVGPRHQAVTRPPQAVSRNGRTPPAVTRNGVKKPSRLERRVSASIDKVKALKDKGRNRVLVLVANGPSISEVDLTKLQNHNMIDIMLINKPDKRLWPPNYWSFCDQSQFNRNKELFESYKGTLINSSSVRANHPHQVVVRNRPSKGFSKDLTQGYHIGRSTTYASMQIAHWMGYEKIFIFGCDMCAVNGKLHYYGKNPDVAEDIRVKRFAREADSYEVGAKELNADERKRFVFCSSYNHWPFVEKYERMDHRKAIPTIIALADTLAPRI